MSNASVGNIYHQIINEVIEASRVDFEDQGVGEEVLEELRKVCSFLSFLSLRCTSHHPPPTATHRHQDVFAVPVQLPR
jgi:hypothetical protein